MSHEQHAPARFAPPAGGLDPTKGIALYVQLADLWRYQILSGAWAAGQRLDNFESLAAHYGVARITVRQAVARLVQEGLLTSQRGRGTTVQAVAARASGEAAADEAEIRIVYKQRAAELPEEFRGRFGVFDGYMEIAKLHVVRGLPFSMVRAFVAEEIYRRFPRRGVEREKIMPLTYAHGGTAAGSMRQRMTVEPADVLIAQHLQYAVGSPVAKVLRQIRGPDDRLAYAAISWYRGESFEMDITLPRELVRESSPALIKPRVRKGKG